MQSLIMRQYLEQIQAVVNRPISNEITAKTGINKSRLWRLRDNIEAITLKEILILEQARILQQPENIIVIGTIKGARQ